MEKRNPYEEFLKEFQTSNGRCLRYFDLQSLGGAKFRSLPFSVRVLLESAVRNCDEFQVKKSHVEEILNWAEAKDRQVEIPFRPARVILQDFTGVPAVVDFAAMRDAVAALGGDPSKINPVCPADLVVDHSVQADVVKRSDAVKQNQDKEFDRNRERFQFLKWGAKAFKNMVIVPPGSGIVHQVNLEYLGRAVFLMDDMVYPDSLVGTDSHTTMINGMGILGWGVGGIEAEAVMLGQAISMVLPHVVGYRLHGAVGPLVTSTDVVLTITKHLRQVGVVGKFVEFFGPGVEQLSIADRATISNMCPEYGATVGYFASDQMTMKYLRQTGRTDEHLEYVEKYLKLSGLFRNYGDPNEDPAFSQIFVLEGCISQYIKLLYWRDASLNTLTVCIGDSSRSQIVELDLSTVVTSLSGPKRPQDRVPVSEMKEDFQQCLENKVGFKGFKIDKERQGDRIPFVFEGQQFEIGHGSVVISAITSCTNTSNPSVMLGAGLLAKKAVDAGLSVAPYVKTSLSPGSGVVTYYLKESGVTPYLEKLGFHVIGYGCMTCIGNSGPLPEPVEEAILRGDLVTVGVLSGNRNFEGRIHPLTRANYLASPLLVIAYAIAGHMSIDFEREPLGVSKDGRDVYLKDVWPTRDEIQAVEREFVVPAMFKEVYSAITTGTPMWQELDAPDDTLYPWDDKSTYIQKPPFFKEMTREIPPIQSIEDAYVLLNLGDSVTTDHISPAGSIARNSAAARYLASHGLVPRQFNSYGSRRGNDAVMARGTFANTRLTNNFLSKPGPKTIYLPTGEEMDVYDVAARYREDKRPLIVLAGKDYGSGSSRDWAAKGPWMLGIRAVIAESFERIHRSNLIGMGIIPLQYMEGQSASSLQLTGQELFSIPIPEDLQPGQVVTVQVNGSLQFQARVRFDTDVEVTYFRHGGILNYMIRRTLGAC